MPSRKFFMSARKMCIRPHKNGKGILTYYRGGVIVEFEHAAGACAACCVPWAAAPPQATRGLLGLDSACNDGREIGYMSRPCLAPSG